MANIKRLELKGWLPFDLGNRQELYIVLGRLNLPANGCKFLWTGKQLLGPKNSFNGNSTFYEFELVGEEALSESFFDELYDLCNKVKGCMWGHVYDIEFSDNEDILVRTYNKPQSGFWVGI